MDLSKHKVLIQFVTPIISGITLFFVLGFFNIFSDLFTDVHHAMENSNDNKQNIVEIKEDFSDMVEAMRYISDKIDHIDTQTSVLKEKNLTIEKLSETNARRIDVLYERVLK